MRRRLLAHPDLSSRTGSPPVLAGLERSKRMRHQTGAHAFARTCRRRRLSVGWHSVTVMPKPPRARLPLHASAAGRPPSGSAGAASARPGAASPRRPRPGPGRGRAGDLARRCRSGRCRSRTRLSAPAACPSSTGCSAAGWCPGPRSCSPASPASASPRCCWRWPRRPPAPAPRTLYVTGEESASQVRLRADRTGGVHDELYLAAETDLGAVLSHIEEVRPTLLVIDSVQTIGAAGTSTACRAASPRSRRSRPR